MASRFKAVRVEDGCWQIHDTENDDFYCALMGPTMNGVACIWHMADYWRIPRQLWVDAIALEMVEYMRNNPTNGDANVTAIEPPSGD